jgi:hypothetical protein
MLKGEGVGCKIGKIDRNEEKILSIPGNSGNAPGMTAVKVFMNYKMINIRAMESIDIKRVIWISILSSATGPG